MIAGAGLHSGSPAVGWWRRADGSGLRWRLPNGHEERLGPGLARRTAGVLATDLEVSGHTLRTVEHWLAAAVGLGLGGLVFGCEGPEMPGCGGSAQAIVEALDGLMGASSRVPLRRWSPPVALTVSEGGAWARWLPERSDKPGALRVRYRIDFPGTVIGVQEVDLDLTEPESFRREVAGARTFAVAERLEQVIEARSRGVGAGLGEGDGLVAGESRWLHGEPLRWSDEAARHKVLDALGDLGTLGVRPAGTLIVERGGHRLHRLLARAAARFLVGPPSATPG